MNSTTRQYGRDDVDYQTWYSDWMKRLASTMTRSQIEEAIGVKSKEASAAARQHLSAVEATHSMGGQGQRRAQTRNVMAAAGEHKIALSGALEIHDLFPEYAMKDSQ